VITALLFLLSGSVTVWRCQSVGIQHAEHRAKSAYFLAFEDSGISGTEQVVWALWGVGAKQVSSTYLWAENYDIFHLLSPDIC